MEDLYVVKYNSGSCEYFRVNILFTCNRDYAEKYTQRFNRVLEYFKKRSYRMRDKYGGLSDDYMDFSKSFYEVREMSNAYYEPIQFRN